MAANAKVARTCGLTCAGNGSCDGLRGSGDYTKKVMFGKILSLFVLIDFVVRNFLSPIFNKFFLSIYCSISRSDSLF